MGSDLPQGRHQFHPRPSRFGLVRKLGENHRTQAALQSQLRLLPHTYHGRGKEHDLAISDLDRFQVS